VGKLGLSDDWRDDLPFQRLAVKCTGTHCDSNGSAVDRMNRLKKYGRVREAALESLTFMFRKMGGDIDGGGKNAPCPDKSEVHGVSEQDDSFRIPE